MWVCEKELGNFCSGAKDEGIGDSNLNTRNIAVPSPCQLIDMRTKLF